MTQVAEPAKQEVARPAPPSRAHDERKGRLPVVVALILSLIGCGFVEQWAVDWKKSNSGEPAQLAERGALSGMDSYALALMLGGLRGPLVMILWSKVENQKMDKDLEDMDTMIEWIRLLQPEFDTVHIFQIWNKAYNISVMMASPATKYTTILDAVDYARRVERSRPGDLNIADSLARVFSEKLSAKNVTERSFYLRQFREDSLTPDNRTIAYPEDARYHRLGIRFVNENNGPLLDERNNIDPTLLQQVFPRPGDLPPGTEWNDGSELQYLAKYQPFPYGISPIAMGWNYAKQAQVAMVVGGQRPLQIGDTVVDSRPGLVLKQWAENEADRGITYETQAFGKPHDAEPHDLEAATGGIGPDGKITDSHALDAALYSYELSTRLCADAMHEYARHLANSQYVNPYQNYASHIDELKGAQAESTGDRAFLASFQPGADRAALLAEAARAYRQVQTQYERMILKYAIEDGISEPMYRSKKVDLDKLDEKGVDQLYRQALEAVSKVPPRNRQFDDQRSDYGGYVLRAEARLRQLAAYNQSSARQIR